ncbi:MAG: hypothetical protein COT26_00225 [Candidatus Kerfeldbacteria bacterium CG08_land_8_20_14_0_20_43_14]|uniref:Uncharacterized protein n=1 Tax=Candidatus Kerfeldbacteria bacterium CG08_land_8_20_14_0_20_43_14 TaxID=2014246 RepID=A0A2H0YTE3_9BACT|nr:MAG: hypothetical protein COT26_00225 [Candidatus Kerfeldbacteria bacterium CG08_land_8_20_14_0_20_43_14]
MTGEKLLEIISLYDKILAPYPAKQLERYDVFPETDEEFLAHLRWMLGEMRERALNGKLKKALRWLGFIQGVLAGKALRTIAQLREDSRSA